MLQHVKNGNPIYACLSTIVVTLAESLFIQPEMVFPDRIATG